MTHIKHRVSCTIIIAEIDRTWCRTMNDHMALGEAADVLVAIGAEHTIAKFMAMDGLDCIEEIQ